MTLKHVLGGIALSGILLLSGCAMDTTHRPATSAVSDTSLTDNVTLAVQSVPGIEPDDLRVSTQNGVVTLRGRTQTRAQAQDAIEAARHVPGVLKVDYDIHVND